jgi:hypothetical protein
VKFVLPVYLTILIYKPGYNREVVTIAGMSKIRFDLSSVPFALLLFCLISFGVLIPWLGFYWDDWPAIWYLHIFGPAGYGDVFAIDRPLLGKLFSLTTPWLGTSTFGWQLFGVFTRWISVLAFWLFLQGLWQKYPSQTTWTALLFAVYPGFKQQFISVTYSHAWIVATVFLLSLGSMVWAFRKPRFFWLLMVVSWALAAFNLFTVEYYFGLELLRPIFLWFLVSEEVQTLTKKIKRTTILWIPYILIIVAFLYWRLFLYETARGHVQVTGKLIADPLGTLLDLFQNVVVDVANSGVIAWAQIFDLRRMTSFGNGPTLLYLAGSAVAGLIAIFYLSKFNPITKTNKETKNNNWALQAIGFGFIALLVAGIPFWFTNLPIGLEFPWDRFTLAMMFGSSLLIAGLVDLITRNRIQKVMVFSIIIGLASGLHLQYANLYRREWNSQAKLFWQLSWRAPQIEPNTVLLTAEMPFTYFSDNSLTAPLNWTYQPDFSGKEMPYLLYSAEARHEVSVPGFDPGIEIRQPYRATEFLGSTSQALVFYYTPPGCLKFVDSVSDKRIPQKPNFISDMMPLSKLDLIIPSGYTPARPPQEIFGVEPEHDWCYYFERAELARQVGDWGLVASLGDQAQDLGQQLYEINAPELTTYIEGYAHNARWKDAMQLTEESLRLSERMDRMLCDTWNRINAQTPNSAEKEIALVEIKEKLPCMQ